MIDPKDYIYIADSSKLIIVYREAEKPETAQAIRFFDYVNELANGKRFHMVLDLSQASPPSAAVRQEFKKGFGGLDKFVKSYSIFFGKNFLLKITAKFVGSSIGLQNYKTYGSVEKAIQFIEENGE